MVPRREEKREEKPEGAGHRRRKEVVVPRREEKREKLQMQQKTGCRLAPCSVFIHCTDAAYCTSEVVSAFCFLISSKPFNTAS